MNVVLRNILGSLLLVTIFLGCNDGNDKFVDDLYTKHLPSFKKINQLVIKDVNNFPLTNATIKFINTSNTPSAPVDTFIIGNDGSISFDEIDAGNYELFITHNDINATVSLNVKQLNFQTSASITAPFSTNDVNTTLIDDAVISSISGSVFDANGEFIPNAYVSLSAGSVSNGSFITAISDENGTFKMYINASGSLASSLEHATITARIPGYTSASTTIKVTNFVNLASVNLQLSDNFVNGDVIYSDDFENNTSSWSMNKIDGSNQNTNWYLHSSSSIATSKAYINNHVKLAPNDLSTGKTPLPYSGSQCFAYGNGVLSDDAYGSFIDTDSGPGNLDGGTGPKNKAELISPNIDLSSATGALYLRFQTWWEIESVNPNNNGFDIMTISVSTDDGTTWKDLARLNPLSDPATTLNRAPIPFGNTGFNAAPTWLLQEGISLIDTEGHSVSGQNIRLKFTFDTVDGLYNGFRGWYIDDLEIVEGEGSFPLLSTSRLKAPSFSHSSAQR